ncbi:SufD family Fe-S cluster assembly protein [bacterium]|nr:SufD family Fe-S cluster assembly protein [bacterium]
MTYIWPTRKEEIWRRSPFLKPPEGEMASSVGCSPTIAPDVEENVTIDNGEIISENLPDGVSITSLEKGNGKISISSLPGGEGWAEWSIARGKNSVISVAPDVVLEKPLIVRESVSPQGGTLSTQLGFDVGVNGSGQLVHLLEGPEDSHGFFSGIITLRSAEGARAGYTFVQALGRGIDGRIALDSHVAKESRLQTGFALLGGGKTRTEWRLGMEGTGGESILNGILLPAAGQEMEVQTGQDHVVGDTLSNLLVKAGAGEGGKTQFQGMINIRPQAQRSNAYQTNRNLAFSPHAQIGTIPGLEIEANDVKCSHGATVHRLETKALFYLASRGIGKEEASRLLAEGFFAEIADDFPAVGSWVVDAFARRLTSVLG